MSSREYLCGNDKKKKQKQEQLMQSLSGSPEKYLTFSKQSVQEQITREKEHKRQVLIRIIVVVKSLAKNNLAFRGNNEKIYEEDNGIFLSMIQMIAEFDPVIQGHLRRIQTNQLRHEEQLSLIIRCVDYTDFPVKIEEFFLGFIKVDDTAGMSLFSELENVLSDLGLNIDDIRGQGYDNRPNMKEHQKDVQSRLLNVNPRAFCTPCGCHSLNLALCDMANSSSKAISYFGVLQRLYTLFSSSTKWWDILERHVTGLTLKPLSHTRWESHIESVKPIKYYALQIRDALVDLARVTEDPKTSSEAESLDAHEFESFEFLVSNVIWYEVLYVVNMVSKTFQSEDMHIDVAIDQLKGLIAHFREYKEHGFNDALIEAQELARQMDVEPVFLERRQIRKKIHVSSEETMFSPQESFRLEFFMYIVDKALASLDEIFEQFRVYERNFGFLYDLKKCTNDECLKSSCQNLSNILTHNGQIDVDMDALFTELQLVKRIFPSQGDGPIQVINYLKQYDGCFPYTEIVYRIMLTIPVTVASGGKSFSKLKLIKN